MRHYTSAHYVGDLCLTCYLHWDSFQPRFVIASQFDGWASWRRDIDADPITSEQAVDVGCGRAANRNWIVWRGGEVSGTWARIFDDQGAAIGPTFLVDGQYPLIGSGDGIRVLVDFEKAIVILNTQSGDILMRAYTLEGAPLTDLIPIAAMPGVLQYERKLSVTSLPDGGLFADSSREAYTIPSCGEYSRISRSARKLQSVPIAPITH